MSAPASLEQEVVSTVSSADLSLFSLIGSADIIGKLIILILILFSIWSWTIIVSKFIYYSSIKKKIKIFENHFWSGQVLNDLYDRIKRGSNDNPLSAIFIGAMDECKKSRAPYDLKTDLLKIGHKDRVTQSMYLARNRNIEELEKNIGFLATIGSSSPFIGLFGTVWGIMHSFQSIAASKNTTLAVVAPGIAEALLATAIGLFVAIPAVIFYNYFSAQIDNIYNKSDDFIGELSAIVLRAIDEEKM